MDVGNMRVALLTRYPGWKKVHDMQDNQVIAIYHRLLHDNDLAPRKRGEVSKLKPKTAYYCLQCFSVFEADNPDLEECRFCGSKITKEADYEYRNIERG